MRNLEGFDIKTSQIENIVIDIRHTKFGKSQIERMFLREHPYLVDADAVRTCGRNFNINTHAF